MANGIVIIDKPQDWTSMDVCAKLRGILHTKRVGHAGTLDPMATGVLPVFVGHASRAVSFAEDSRKEYIATLQLGIVTDTQDISGTVLEKREITVGREDLLTVLPSFTGLISQVPPMYSAIKVNGQKLYDLARKGREVERKPREITIYDLELLEQTDAVSYKLRIECSKGTYIRTLLHDIGQQLGCGGCMSSLRRTKVAGFTLSDAHSIEEVAEYGEAILSPVDSLFMEYLPFHLENERQSMLCHNGNPFFIKTDLADGNYRIYDLDGTFLCISHLEDGKMVSVKNFFGAVE